MAGKLKGFSKILKLTNLLTSVAGYIVASNLRMEQDSGTLSFSSVKQTA